MMLTSRHPIDRLRDAVEAVGQRTRNDTGGGFRARCPAHDGKSDGSLAVSTGRDGRLLVCCHGGCATDAVLAVLGLGWDALGPERTDRPAPYIVPRATVIEPPPHDPATLAAWADEAHRRLLTADVAGPARAYLRDRGVTGEDVRTYRLGFAVGHPDRKLGRLRARVVFVEWPWRAEGRVVPGLEASTYQPVRRYQTEGPKRAWGVADVNPDRPVVLVEGLLDRIAVGRLAGPTQTVALCGSSGVRRDDVSTLRTCGVREVLVFLDADVNASKWDRVMGDLAAGGIRPVALRGLDDGDPGDLLPALTRDEDDAWHALSEALTTPEVRP